MTSNPSTLNQWQRAALDGACVIASSERLARDLRLRYASAMASSGRKGWLAPDIRTLRTHVIETWNTAMPARQLASNAQELHCWIRHVAQTPGGAQLINPNGIARAARDTARLLMRHGALPQALRPEHPTLDEASFLQSWSAVLDDLARLGLANEEQVLAEVLLNEQACADPLSTPTILIGFERSTGLIAALRDQLTRRGAVRHDESPGDLSKISRARCGEPRDQYAVAASWARNKLRTNPDARAIAILVPDLAAARTSIDAALAEHLSPQTLLDRKQRHRKPWRYSRGEPMADHPLFTAALDLLTLLQSPATVEDWSRCLLSPWLFTGTPSDVKAAVDWALRSAGGSRCTDKRVAGLIRTAQLDEAAAPLLDLLEHPRAASRHLPSAWVDEWLEQLRSAQWSEPQLTDADGSERQHIADIWMEGLDQLRAMDDLLGAVTATQALQWLREVFSDLPVQPPEEHEQPIQVMSYSDADSLRFDHVIVLGASSTEIPPRREGVGFLQDMHLRGLGLPQADPALHLASWTQWVDLLPAMSGDVTILTPLHTETGAEVSVSPLMLACRPVSLAAAATPLAPALSRTPALDLVDEPPVPPVPPGARIRGGTAIFKNTAISPFVAFARHRLGLQPFPQAADGLDALTQGHLLHEALNRIWGVLRTSAALAAIQPADLDTLVNDAVAAAAAQHLPVEAYGRGLVANEQLRVARVCHQWLAHERLRSYPFEVIGREVRQHVRIGQLEIPLAYDRLDRIELPDGRFAHLLIDYKTGSSPLPVKGWNPEVMSEPQLPIYATCVDWPAQNIPQIDGIAFARVVRGSCQFQIRSSFADKLVPNSRGLGNGDAHWDITLQQMRAALVSLADAFMQSDLSLDRRRLAKARGCDDLNALARELTEEPNPLLASPF